MILHGRIVEQIDRSATSAPFVKEIVVTGGRVPLAMVRKRLAGQRRRDARAGPAGPRLRAEPLRVAPARAELRQLPRARRASTSSISTCAATAARVTSAPGAVAGVEDYVREDLPAAVEEVQALSGGRPRVARRSLARRARELRGGARPRRARSPASSSIGSPYHFTRGSLTLGASRYFFRALASHAPAPERAARRSRPSAWPCACSAASPRARSIRFRCAAGTPARCEPHVLEQHLRLAFDRAGVAEMRRHVRLGGAAALRRPTSPTTSSASRRWTCRCSSSPAPTTTSRRRRACARRSSAVARATRRTAPLPLGHIDLLVGRDAPLMTWSLVGNWLEKRAA